jgi:outer membrane immunogenic protein
MRTLSLIVAAAAVVFTPPALAADLPRAVPAKAPVLVAVPTWTGWYAGLNAGYGWGGEAIHISGDPAVTVAIGIANGVVPSTIAKDLKGFIGGGQVGYNHQFGQWMLGVEADIQWSDIKRNQTILTAVPGPFPPFRTSDEQKLEWLGTLRGRVGFSPAAPWLIYGTAGLAYGQVAVSGYSALNFPALPICTGTYCGASSLSSTEVGWTAGGGFEFAFARAWSVKAEYLYWTSARFRYSCLISWSAHRSHSRRTPWTSRATSRARA